jgi:hypothetical protein
LASSSCCRVLKMNCKRLCDRLHVILRVTAIHTDSVQFHQFACIVLVRVALAIRHVIKVDQHRWTMSAGIEQVTEFAHRMRPSYFAVVDRLQEPILVLAEVDVEVVRPEIHHDLAQLVLAIHRVQNRGLIEFEQDNPALVIRGLHKFRWCHG